MNWMNHYMPSREYTKHGNLRHTSFYTVMFLIEWLVLFVLIFEFTLRKSFLKWQDFLEYLISPVRAHSNNLQTCSIQPDKRGPWFEWNTVDDLEEFSRFANKIWFIDATNKYAVNKTCQWGWKWKSEANEQNILFQITKHAIKIVSVMYHRFCILSY